MINRTVFRREWRANLFLLIIFIGVLAMYASMIIYMFDPKMGDSLQVMADSMPEVFAAFGMADVGKTLLEFITGYLYGILFTAFPAVYILILANRLVVRYVDNGSMVYLLSAPQHRCSLIWTQILYLMSALVVLLLVTIGVILGCSQAMFPGELELLPFVRVNIGLFGLWIMLAGVCFFCSCICNESRRSLSMGSAFVVYSVLVQMLSQVGDVLEKLKYITPFTLLQVDELAAGKTQGWVCCGIMYLIGIGFMVIGGRFFCRRDLPL